MKFSSSNISTKVYTVVAFAINIVIILRNNTRHASADFGSIRAPRWVTSWGAW